MSSPITPSGSSSSGESDSQVDASKSEGSKDGRKYKVSPRGSPDISSSSKSPRSHSMPVEIRPRSISVDMPQKLQRLHEKVKESPRQVTKKNFEEALSGLKKIISHEEVGMLSPRSSSPRKGTSDVVPSDVSIDDLILEFLNDPNGQEVIASEKGRKIIQSYVNEILEKFQDDYPSSTSQLVKELWKSDSKALIESLKKIIGMNKKGKTLPHALKEFVATEEKFNRRLHLMFDKNWDNESFFTMLKNKHLISENDYQILNSGWKELSECSEKLINKLTILKDDRVTPEEKMEALVELIKSDEMKNYYQLLGAMSQKYVTMDELLNNLSKQHQIEWGEILGQFKKLKADSLEDPFSILAEPFQRVTRLPLVMTEILNDSQFFTKDMVESFTLSLALLKLRSKNVNAKI